MRMKRIGILSLSLLLAALCACSNFSENAAKDTARALRLDPDYSETVIPPNIAPLNFRIVETGDRYLVRARAGNVELTIKSRDGKICFPLKAWKRMLASARGGELVFEVFIRQNGVWLRFPTIRNRISEDEIDSHLTYRLINPAYKYWNRMGIYQRNLETFEERPMLINRMTDGNCMNCHNFRMNDPADMVLHLRTGAAGGTLVSVDGEWRKVSLKTSFNKGGAYPSWHPNGKTLAFSVNDLTMFYHALGEPRDVLDRGSDIVVYHIDRNMISASPQIADEGRMETFPAWTADGRRLYFCSAGPFDSYLDASGDLKWGEIRYDLMRVEYDPERDEWGRLETVVPAEKMGLSASLPRPSPDGKWVLFCMAQYGSFPIYHQHGDLYLLEEATGRFRRLEINSDETDSFHSWSSNSRWFVFTSKRYDTLLGKPFFAHIDEDGHVSKPFLMPQKHPDFYKTFIINYNVPELTRGAVPKRLQALSRVAFGKQIKQASLDPRVTARRDAGKGDQEAMYNRAQSRK